MNLKESIFDSIWFPFSYHADVQEHPPIVIERGEGVYVYDRHGKSYLDAIGSWWLSILGHSHPEVTTAIRNQLDKIQHVLMAGMITPPTLRCAELLKSLLPAPLKRIFFSDDGSTAVEVALKMALQYWWLKGERRTKFIALGGAYHGDTLGAMSVGGIASFHHLYHELFSKQLFTDPPDCFRCPVDKEKNTCAAECMNSLETLLMAHGEHVAACIFEPMIQGASGMRIYPAKVLDKIYNICRRFGILTIADEIAMGFGRTGRLFASQHADHVPDIMCLAKGLTAGYLPMAVTVAKDHVYEEFRGAFPSDRILHHGHSFTGNPLAASASAATLEVLIKNRIPESLESISRYFQKQLSTLNDLPMVGETRSLGMVGAIELVADKFTKKALPKELRIPFRICRACLDKGLLVRPLGDVIYFIPAYCITTSQIDTMISITRTCVQALTNDEFAHL